MKTSTNTPTGEPETAPKAKAIKAAPAAKASTAKSARKSEAKSKPAKAESKKVAKAAPAKAVPAKAAAAPEPAPVAATDQQKALQEKVRELIKLAKEQGYVTYDDLDEALPEGVNDPDSIESVITQLRAVEIEIIDASDVDRVKDVRKDDEEEEKDEKSDSKLDKEQKSSGEFYYVSAAD